MKNNWNERKPGNDREYTSCHEQVLELSSEKKESVVLLDDSSDSHIIENKRSDDSVVLSSSERKLVQHDNSKERGENRESSCSF